METIINFLDVIFGVFGVACGGISAYKAHDAIVHQGTWWMTWPELITIISVIWWIVRACEIYNLSLW